MKYLVCLLLISYSGVTQGYRPKKAGRTLPLPCEWVLEDCYFPCTVAKREATTRVSAEGVSSRQRVHAVPCLSAQRSVISHRPTQVLKSKFLLSTFLKWSHAWYTMMLCIWKKKKCVHQCELKLFGKDKLPSPQSLVQLLPCAVEWAAGLSFAPILIGVFYCQPKAVMYGFSWSSLREFTEFLHFSKQVLEKDVAIPENRAQSCVLLPRALVLY